MIPLPSFWRAKLAEAPETGMGYQIVTIQLLDGREFKQVAIIGDCIGQIRGFKDIPFAVADIVNIELTHEKWDW